MQTCITDAINNRLEGSHSLTYKNSTTFPGLSRTPWERFPRICLSQALFNYKDKQSSYLLYTECDSTIHCGTVITSWKGTVQLATQYEYFGHLFTNSAVNIQGRKGGSSAVFQSQKPAVQLLTKLPVRHLNLNHK